MTIEEAGEIILSGVPFIDCAPCGGTGYRDEVVDEENQLVRTRGCEDCGGNQRIVRPEYKEACELLSIEVPNPEQPPGPTLKELTFPPFRVPRRGEVKDFPFTSFLPPDPKFVEYSKSDINLSQKLHDHRRSR